MLNVEPAAMISLRFPFIKDVEIYENSLIVSFSDGTCGVYSATLLLSVLHLEEVAYLSLIEDEDEDGLILE